MVKDQATFLFRVFLFFLKAFRLPYLWARNKWPDHFAKRLGEEVDLNTSRMLTEFNGWHRFFFGSSLSKIGIDDKDLGHLKEAYARGPVVLLLRNWGQVEYNFFNYLFLKEDFPLAIHNNMVRMAHWMPGKSRRQIVRQKMNHFFMKGVWPTNESLFELDQSLKENHPFLLCLDLPKGNHRIMRQLEPQSHLISNLMEAQLKLERPIQLVPLHFIYDKHPGKERKSLIDILLGDREHPGFFRKIILFLRDFKKRAVAKISDPIDLRELMVEKAEVSPENRPRAALISLVRIFDQGVRQVTGPKLKRQKDFLAKIKNDPHFQQKLKKLAREEGISYGKATKKAGRILKEIASDISFTLIELWNYFLGWLLSRFYEGLIVDKEGIAQIKKVAKDTPLVLIPSHKSHMDYLLLSYVFYHNDLSLPLVCTGVNLSFWPLGSLYRKSGGYFIRRSFAGDKLYTLTFKSYVHELMREGFFQEFFIEGTRSRSGKLFPPRTGLLSMIIESFLEGGIKDVHFVPISIDYEKILEESAYIHEIEGGKKEKEKMTDLLHLPKFLKKRYGKVYVQFSEPISLKKELQKPGEGVEKDKAALRQFVANLADKISCSINQVSTLLPTSLVATALLTPKNKSITGGEVHNKCEELYRLLPLDRIHAAEGLKKNFHHTIQEALDLLVKEGTVESHQYVDEKFYTLPDTSRQKLNLMKNRLINLFAEASILTLSQIHQENPLNLKPSDLSTWTEGLLGREFYYFSDPALAGLDTIPTWISSIIRPILETYWLTLTAIKRLQPRDMEEWLLLRKIMEVGQLFKVKGSLEYPESISRFSIQNALVQFVKMGVLGSGRKKRGSSFRKFLSVGPAAAPAEEAERILKLLLDKPEAPGNIVDLHQRSAR